MGVAVDAMLDPLTVAQRAAMMKIDQVKLPETQVEGAGPVFAVSHKPNAGYELVNAALAMGGGVAMAPDAVKTTQGVERGAWIVSGLSRASVAELATRYAVGAEAITSVPAHAISIRRAKVGLYRPWDASIDEGWSRWILENYHFEPKSIYNADMRSSGQRSRYDVIVLPDMSKDQLVKGFPVGSVPGQYAGGIEQDGVNNLREFVRAGGTLIAFNQSAASLIPLLSLPVRNVLQDVKPDAFYCAGALLRVEMSHPELPVNYGVPNSPVVMFERGPAFEALPGFKGAVLAKYSKQTDALESGMILHAELLEDKAAALELAYGEGHILLYGFKPQHRAQAHGTYRYLFNALYLYDTPAMPTDLPSAPAAEADKKAAKPATPAATETASSGLSR